MKTVLSQLADILVARYKNSLLDFRSYLEQRWVISSSPLSALDRSKEKGPEWKSPIAFALQGYLIAPAILHVIAISLGLFLETQTVSFTAMDDLSLTLDSSRWLLKGTQIEGDIEILIDEVITFQEASPSDKLPTPVLYSKRGTPLFEVSKEIARVHKVRRDKAIEVRASEIKRLRYLLRHTRYMQHLELGYKWSFFSLAPLVMLLVAAHVFKLMLPIGAAQHAMLSSRAEDLFLYFVTASFFWVHLVSRVFVESVAALEIYFFPRFDIMRETPGPWWIPTLLFYLPMIIGPVLLAWYTIVLKHTSGTLRRILGFDPAPRWYSFWSGGYRMGITIFVSVNVGQVFAILVVAIVSIGYAYTAVWLQDLVRG